VIYRLEEYKYVVNNAFAVSLIKYGEIMQSIPSFSIVVTTSYKYRNLIDGFLFFYSKYCVDCKYEVILSLEKEERENFESYKFLSSNSTNWSERLIETLNKIDSEYIYLMLDDYFLINSVNHEKINQILTYAKLNKIQHIKFHTSNSMISSDDEINFISIPKSKKKFSYYVVAEGFYHRESLIRILNMRESAWEFELYASLRAVLDSDFNSMLAITNSPLPYLVGGVICKGKIRQAAYEFLRNEKFELYFEPQKVKVSTDDTNILIRAIRKVLRVIKISIIISSDKIRKIKRGLISINNFKEM
jgi:hypothetical protein